MKELIYTSSSKGVDQGSQGYCTVACSDAMPPMLRMNLENMSEYSWIYPPHDKDFVNNPINFSYVKVKVGDEWQRVISRIGLNGLDYSGRPNKIANFLCLDEDDLDECHEFSPAQICSSSKTFIESWDDESSFTETDLSNLSHDSVVQTTNYWQEVTGDENGASYLINLYREASDSQITVIYDAHVDPLKLIAEATSLLSNEECWDVTFSTYFNGTSLNSTCDWQFVLRGSKYHESLKSTKNVIDLNNLPRPAEEDDLDLEISLEELPNLDTDNSQMRINHDTSYSQGLSQKNKSNIALKIFGGAVCIGLFFLVNPFAGKTTKAPEYSYSYHVTPKPILAGDELEKFGDVLISINTDDFLAKLKANKMMSLDIFSTPPEKITVNLVSTKEYKVFDNVLCKLRVERVEEEFVQKKEEIIEFNSSDYLTIKSLSKIDQKFIQEFKKNIKKMKVNRIIFEFI